LYSLKAKFSTVQGSVFTEVDGEEEEEEEK
jgi:hypothetical protein